MIFNFGQLKVGAQKFSQEVREILTQMPSLRRTFLSAFGTLDPQKIQALFDTNPDAFFEKLSAEMSKTKGITSDTIDSFEKLQDEFIKAGREFAKPLLPGITAELQNATAYLRDNGAAWVEWGQSIADVIRGARIEYDEFRKSRDDDANSFQGKSKAAINDPIINTLSSAAGTAFNYLNPGFGDFKQIFTDLAETASDKTSALVKAQQDKLKREAERIEEFKTQQANKEFDRIAKDELQRNEALRILESYHSSRIAVIQNALSIESALADAKPVFNLEQEKESLKRQTDLRSDGLNAQLRVETDFYKEQERLNAGNKLELEKIELARGKALGKIQTDIIVNQIKGQQEIEKIDRQIILQKREAIQELNRLSAQSVQQSLDTTTFNFDRASSLGGFGAAASNQFRDELANSYSEQIRLSSEFHRTQLLDESLTAEQIVNIKKRLNLEQTSLSEDLRRRLLDIGDKQYAAQLQQMEGFGRALVDRYQATAKFYGDIGQSFFSASTFGADTAGNIDEILLRKTDITRLSKNLADAGKEITDLNTAIQGVYGAVAEGGELTAKQREAVDKLSVSWLAAISKESAFRTELEKLKDTIPGVYYEFGRLAKQIEGGNVKAFDVATRTALEARQKLERASLQSEIDALPSTKDKDGKEVLGLIDLAKKQGDFVRAKQLELKITQLLQVQESQRLTQANELTEQYSQSIDGLIARLERLRAGNQAEEAGFRYSARQSILGEQIGQYGEIITLKERLANSPLLSAQSVEIAQLNEIVRLQQEFQNAAASRAITGNRVSIIENVAKQQREQALREKQTEQSRVVAGQTAALARIKGLENEEELKKEILRRTAEEYLEIERKYQESLGNIKAGDGAVRPKAASLDALDKAPAAARGFFEGIGIEKFTSDADAMQSTFERIGQTGAIAFNSLATAMGSVVEQWVLYGSVSGESAKKAIASALAAAAAQSTVSAIMETAYGIAALTPWGALIYGPAPFHFKSAALFASVALGTAIAGRAVAGNSFSQGGTGGGGSNQGQPDYHTSPPVQQPTQQPQITPQQITRTGESATIARLEGVIQRLSEATQKHTEVIEKNSEVTETHSQVVNEAYGRINGISKGKILEIGANENPGVFGRQTPQDLKTGRTSPTDFRKGLGTS